MKTKAIRLYGKNDIREGEFQLPEIKDDEILVKIISDSICMSTYKLLIQGEAHKRAPQNIATHPVIIGHEFAGQIVQVGKKWQGKYNVGEKFVQQPALNYKGSLDSPGYSYEFCGGSSEYAIMPNEVMELGCLFKYNGDAYYESSLSEPFSCIVGGYNAMYHTNKQNYQHSAGIKAGGKVLILGGAGPMGFGAIEYALNSQVKPALVVMTDINGERLARAEKLIPVSKGAAAGVELKYVNTADYADGGVEYLRELTDGHGYDDVFVYAPVVPLAEQGDKLLAFDGCMNFFAGPSDAGFTAGINLYNCHYLSTHIMGSTGGNIDDQKESVSLFETKKINPAVMVSHICGLAAIVDLLPNLPKYSAGKILTYPCIDELPLIKLDELPELAKGPSKYADLYGKLAVAVNGGLWNAAAERVLLDYFGIKA
jgi:threonine dehydrogenase-like Zn-dependent dehydrogenase